PCRSGSRHAAGGPVVERRRAPDPCIGPGARAGPGRRVEDLGRASPHGRRPGAGCGDARGASPRRVCARRPDLGGVSGSAASSSPRPRRGPGHPDHGAAAQCGRRPGRLRDPRRADRAPEGAGRVDPGPARGSGRGGRAVRRGIGFGPRGSGGVRVMNTTTTPARHGRRASRRGANLVRLGLNPSGPWDYLIALAGNPNTGKSTIFNALTGLRQHTGNWPGKTVTRMEGAFAHEGRKVKIVDLPGTYSLQAATVDEEVARDFILFGGPDVVVIVVDATRLERNLNLVLQILEITDRVVVCLNLMDEAKRHGIAIDPDRLSAELGVPVVPTAARRGEGIDDLLRVAIAVASGETRPTPFRIRRHPGPVETALGELVPMLEAAFPTLDNARWVALRLLNGDERVERAVRSGEIGRLVGSGSPVPAALGGASSANGEGRGNGTAGPGGGGPGIRTASAAATVMAGATAGRAPAGVESASHGRADAPEPSSPPGLAGAVDAALILERASELRRTLPPDFHDALMESIYTEAHRIAERSMARGVKKARFDLDRTLDRLLTGRWTGFPIMLLLLMVVFWITISGSNVPSELLASLLLGKVHPFLLGLGETLRFSWWLSGFLFDGVYLGTAWVVSVMLPPMAIFFPLFTLLEDFGYLPRVAFNMVSLFRRVGAHGKQALT